MRSPIKMISGAVAVKLASDNLRKAGFLLLRKNKKTGSHYLTKSGMNFKVRIADHQRRSSQYPDVAFNLVFDYPTINSDVEAQCARIARDYDDFVRNKNRKK
jgi:hypothetical protein